jgi:DNA-binding PadR family transcriptional regulator
MMKQGRFLSREKRKEAEDRMLQALETHPGGLGIREWRKESGVGSFETFYKRLKELSWEDKVVSREENVGRGRQKKIFTLSRKGIAHLVEFKILDCFEEIRKSCKENERFEIDNYDFSYAVYGLPRLDREERKVATTIFAKLNATLMELDDLRDLVINKEARMYSEAITKVYTRIFEHVSRKNKTRRPTVVDPELQKELDSCIPSTVRKKMRFYDKDSLALVITRGPSFIDEYSLRPENYLLDLVQGVENWNDEGIESVIRQLAKNEHVDAETIEKLKQWDAEGKVASFNWQSIKNRLDDIPKIREEMKKEKDRFIQSGVFKRAVGLREEASFVVTRKMIGKRKLDEFRKELSALNNM